MKRKYWFYKFRLADQLLTSFGILLLLAGGISLGLNYYLHQANLEKEVQMKAISITRSLQIAVKTTRLERIEEIRQIVAEYTTLPGVLEVVVLDATGNTLAHTDHDEGDQPYEAVHPELKSAIQKARNTKTDVYQGMLLHGQPALVHILPFTIDPALQAGSPAIAISVLDLKLTEILHQFQQGVAKEGKI
ncbi:MAG TPA: hypothetical protein IGS53_25895 [Leptolyngbyaceae cyanobacterium M33_DOE_097]|uniref:Single cache domain-containing protein n=1 Tax=Oscillatoriales cyanobacterium SpSt-418 TaxID=2282169 RepID=A0A7C3KDB9_9CYAN|nr:hypothetical protein [Leptolyngbyaceae cyanobacterium M33_DOE_097]